MKKCFLCGMEYDEKTMKSVFIERNNNSNVRQVGTIREIKYKNEVLSLCYNCKKAVLYGMDICYLHILEEFSSIGMPININKDRDEQ